MLSINNAKQVLKQYFGFDEFRDFQINPIKAIVEERKNIFIVLPTGGGKSMLYTIPALLFDGITIVVSPLIALMEDQVNNLKNHNIKSEYISFEKNNFEEIKSNINDIKILFVSPERFVSKSFFEFIKTINVSLIALDEAHTFTQFGLRFRFDYRNFFTVLNSLKSQFIALTATASDYIYKDIINNYNFDEVFSYPVFRKNLNININYFNTEYEKNKYFVSNFNTNDVKIIYVNARDDGEYLYKQLGFKHPNIFYYHAKLDKETKKEVYDNFICEKYKAIIATTAFGMGIDKSNIREVYNYSIPFGIEDFTQQIGRGGRDGLLSNTFLLVSFEEITNYEEMFNINGLEQSVDKFLNKLNKFYYEPTDFIEKEILTQMILNNYIEIITNPSIECEILKEYDYYPKINNFFNIIKTKNKFNLNELINLTNEKEFIIYDMLKFLSLTKCIKYNVINYILLQFNKTEFTNKLKESIDDLKEKFLKILTFIFTNQCRHKVLSQFYSNTIDDCKNVCDNCKTQIKEIKYKLKDEVYLNEIINLNNSPVEKHLIVSKYLSSNYNFSFKENKIILSKQNG